MVKVEYVPKMNIFDQKIMVKSDLEKNICKSSMCKIVFLASKNCPKLKIQL